MASPTVWVNKVAPFPKTFCNTFTQAEYITVKFCQFVDNYLYLHVFASLGGFILIFSKLVLM